MNNSKTMNGTLDIVKLILAGMIVALHNDPFGCMGGYRYPLLSLPVPCFFVISSYLFLKSILFYLAKKKRKNEL